MTTTNPMTQALTGTTGTTGTGAAPRNPTSALGKDDFLKLLVGQLKHQDPLAPTDNQQWIGQMAAFSQLEQTTNMANSTEQIVGALDRNGVLSLIGHNVTYLDEAGAAHEGSVERVDVVKGEPTLTVGGVSGIKPGAVTQVR
jgi:flagellar basal-body rod modification protein FlgD